ncbi:MAG: DNA cytosine methyltransferase [Phycisphaerales bacterium]|nr:DNA cytosine methyltransferase [Phycisphaerales bacterium]
MIAPSVLSLFAGIGGFDEGFRQAGFNIAAQVEIDPFCLRVLADRFPKARRYEDIRQVQPAQLFAEVGQFDVVCAGFPCQDISNAGNQAGIHQGERSRLWFEAERIIEGVMQDRSAFCGDRPFYVVVENVAALAQRGLSAVLGSLAALGLDAEWHCLPAAAFGAPHERRRIFVVAYPAGQHDEALFQAAPQARQDHGEWSVLRDLGPRGGVHTDFLRVDQSRLEQGAERFLLDRDDGLCAWVDAGGWQHYAALGNAVCPFVAEFIARRLMQEF